MTTIYIDHAGAAFRKAVDDLLELARAAGCTWVKVEYEHPCGCLRAASSWGAPFTPPSQGDGSDA